jgi:signal transduction histidine kinase
MRFDLLKRFMPLTFDSEEVKTWKRAAYSKTLLYGLIPLCLPLIICFAVVGVWQMALVVIGLVITFIVSIVLARGKLFALAVNLAILSTLLSNFYYLIFLGNCDGLFFTLFMIIIAGIFSGPTAAFTWAIVQTAALVLFAYVSPDYTVFPDFSIYFMRQTGPHIAHDFFSTFILLYIVSASLSILFQRYFKELIQEKAILQSELLQAQKLESIGLFAGGIAHDFSKNLTTIKSCASLILKKFSNVDEDLTKYARNIDKTCGVISDVSSRLLGFTRKTGEKTTLVNMHDAIEGMVALFQYMLPKNIEIKTDLKADKYTIRGNYQQIQNMLMNLAANASDAMPNGGLLHIATKIGENTEEKQQQQYLVLSVTDNGIGMDESIKQQLFKPFFTTKGQRGTGIGLINIKRTVESHHGRIAVESEPGKGSTFTVFLPLASKQVETA